MQWLRPSILFFVQLVQPLLQTFERVYQSVGRRTNRAVRHVKLHQIGWGENGSAAFASCKHMLINLVRIAHHDHTKRLWFYVDASYTHGEGNVAQIPSWDIHVAHYEKRHEPLSFLSGQFIGTQLRCSTLEKEAFSII